MIWRRAGLSLVVKAIAELSYEELLTPEPHGEGYRLELPSGVAYEFRARRGAMGAWRIAPESVRRLPDGPADDPVRLLLDLRPVLSLDGPSLAEALREMLATWTADARMLAELPTAAALAELPYAELESWQGGHPCIVLNKGRLGFSDADTRRYAPEARVPFRLPWLAVRDDLASRHGVPVLAEELDEPTMARFARVLRSTVDDPARYVWLPVHPFHLEAAVRPLFAQFLADGRMVELGEAPDRYRPLAGVRTVVNVDSPVKRNVKLALLIRNTLVWRGLPAGPVAAAPEVTAWLRRLLDRDPRPDFDILGEVASVSVRNPLYDSIPDLPYRFHELLGAVWREPCASRLAPGERARSLASLLITGGDGRALAAELVARSGLPQREWLARLLHALLPGLLHLLHAHGIAFTPHGENTIVVYGPDEVPRRTLVKDLAEDVTLLTDDQPAYADLAPAARAELLRWPPAELAHSIQSAVFAGHFRHFAAIVEDQLGVPEHEFWGLVAAEVAAYRAEHPELAAQHAAFGLTAPRFDRVCLNREQLTGGGFHDRSEKDESFDVTYGTVANPLALP
jgi:aerobactin synthase